MMLPLSDKTKYFGSSMIRAMTHSKHADLAINLGQGFPDFDPPDCLKKTLQQVALQGPHQYAQTFGTLRLRQAIAKKASYFMNNTIDPDQELLVTCGGTEAMMAVLLTLINPGDKIIVFTPYYENYISQALLAGAEILYVPLNWPDFSINYESLEKAFLQKPKAIILCNPSNPTGKVFRKDELERIRELVIKEDTYVITDEVYEHITFEGRKHIYFSELPNMKERTITCASLSKTYAITGWRIGYIYAPAFFISKAKTIHDYLTVCAPAPLQEAVISGLELPYSYYSELQASYQQKKDLFVSGLRNIGLTVTEPEGAYYVLADIAPFKFSNDFEFCRYLIDEIGIVTVPGTSFQRGESTGTVRFHFAKKIETLESALNRLEKLRKKLCIA